MKTARVILTALLTSLVTASAQDLGGDLSLHKLLLEGESWELVTEGLGFSDAPTSDHEGNFYYSDMRSEEGLFKVAPNGKITPLFSGTDAQKISGMRFGADGKLYACQSGLKRVVSFDLPGGKMEVLAEDVQPNDLAVSAAGFLYFTETRKKQVTIINLKTKAMFAGSTGLINAPNGITLSPDQGTLAVSDYRGRHVWTFRVNPDGKLDAADRYMTMRTWINPEGERTPVPVEEEVSGGDGMSMDANGRYYVATKLGVQVFDPTGRECGLILKPTDAPMTSVCVGGPGGQYLYSTCRDKIFRLKIKAKGVYTYQGPVEAEPVPYKR